MINEYEKQRQEQIRKNQEQLKALFGSSIVAPPLKKPAQEKKKKEKVSLEPTRVSKRLKGIAVKEEPVSVDPTEVVVIDRYSDYRSRKRIEGDISLPFSLEFINPKENQVKTEANSTDLDQPVKLARSNIASDSSYVRIKKEKIDPKLPPPSFPNLINPLHEGTVKVTSLMIYSLALHPSKDKHVCAVGDKDGTLAFWDISRTLEDTDDQDPVVNSLRPHSKPISRILYDPKDWTKLYSSSYDSSIRMLDAREEKNTEVYVHFNSSETISHFDLNSGSGCLFSTSDGYAGMLDFRCANKSSATTTNKISIYLPLSSKKLNTIHFNPTDSNYFCVSGTERFIKIFDLRKLSKKNSVNDETLLDEGIIEPVCQFELPNAVNSAYWSPKGDMIASVSFDNTVRVWSNVFDAKPKCKAIKHNTNTGRWVQKLKAVWHPRQDWFCVGNMARCIDVFDGNSGTRIGLLESGLTAVPAVVGWHPSDGDMVVMGNASGRMALWRMQV